MTKSAPPIQGPTDELVATIVQAIEAKGACCSGPAYFWDPVRLVFLMIMVQRGVIVHWHMEPARDQVEADNLHRLFNLTTHVATELALGHLPKDLPPDVRAALERQFSIASDRRFNDRISGCIRVHGAMAPRLSLTHEPCSAHVRAGVERQTGSPVEREGSRRVHSATATVGGLGQNEWTPRREAHLSDQARRFFWPDALEQ